MRLRKIHANTIVFTAGVAILGLAACMQNERPMAVAPATAPYAYGLFYMDEGSSVKLAYGAPNSDDVSLMMQCVKGSHTVDVSDLARDGVAPTLILVSGGKSASLKANASSGDGASLIVARARTDAPPLEAFKHSGRIDVVYSGARYVIAANPGERVNVERFFRDCDHGAATIAAVQAR